VIGVG